MDRYYHNIYNDIYRRFTSRGYPRFRKQVAEREEMNLRIINFIEGRIDHWEDLSELRLRPDARLFLIINISYLIAFPIFQGAKRESIRPLRRGAHKSSPPARSTPPELPLEVRSAVTVALKTVFIKIRIARTEDMISGHAVIRQFTVGMESVVLPEGASNSSNIKRLSFYSDLPNMDFYRSAGNFSRYFRRGIESSIRLDKLISDLQIQIVGKIQSVNKEGSVKIGRDVQTLLLTNFFTLIALPIAIHWESRHAGVPALTAEVDTDETGNLDFDQIGQIMRDDIIVLLDIAVREHLSAAKITAADILRIIDRDWRKLKTTKIEIWG